MEVDGVIRQYSRHNEGDILNLQQYWHCKASNLQVWHCKAPNLLQSCSKLASWQMLNLL